MLSIPLGHPKVASGRLIRIRVHIVLPERFIIGNTNNEGISSSIV
jgi:hypothetical protein